MMIPYKESDWDEPKTTTMVAIKDYKTYNYHRKDKDSIEVLITNY